jgi:hypothetical protein
MCCISVNCKFIFTCDPRIVTVFYTVILKFMSKMQVLHWISQDIHKINRVLHLQNLVNLLAFL